MLFGLLFVWFCLSLLVDIYPHLLFTAFGSFLGLNFFFLFCFNSFVASVEVRSFYAQFVLYSAFRLPDVQWCTPRGSSK